MSQIRHGDVIRNNGGDMSKEQIDREVLEKAVKIALTIVILVIEFTGIFPILYNSSSIMWFMSFVSVIIAFLAIYFIWRRINFEKTDSDNSDSSSGSDRVS